jgi:hypothetical protein
VRQLPFPDNEIVGILDWLGARNDLEGPILASHVVDVPDDVEVSLSIQRVRSVERDDFSGGGFITSHVTNDGALLSERTSSQGWRISSGDGSPLHLGFLLELPRDSITDLRMVGEAVLADSLSSLTHLAPGLKRLYLGGMQFGDDVLQHVARLENLIYLQTWGNRFTDAGVQQLGALQALEMLYLEEESLMPAAFDFVTSLPKLVRLGAADEWPAEQRSVLRARFPGLMR